MADFKQQIDDALDILKFDGAVHDTLERTGPGAAGGTL